MLLAPGIHAILTNAPETICRGVAILLESSDYALRHMDVIEDLIRENDLTRPLFLKEYQKVFTTLHQLDEPLFSTQIRRLRQRFFLRLLIRQYAGLADIIETMASWSDFADAVVIAARDKCQEIIAKKYGFMPLSHTATLYTLAMGKLGGRELNLSSDIDLIFIYSRNEAVNHEESLRIQQFFTRVVQLFLQMLQQVKAEGFVFRVDLRLRPHGESGPLVDSVSAFENYYQEQGRDWERYAMVKARMIGEDKSESAWYKHIIIPFVYRRYVDFGVLESLRTMKSMIEREVQQNPQLDDIKRGFGGIREFEFTLQNIQLIRGGRMPQLRQTNALRTLDVLAQEKLLNHAKALRQAYLFLRHLENCLQAINDQQTHALPQDPDKQQQICRAMGLSDWPILVDKLDQYRRIIRNKFHGELNSSNNNDSYLNADRLLAQQLTSLWQGHVEADMATNLLRTLGYEEPQRCYQLLNSFRHSSRCRRLSQAARIQLDRFMPMLLKELVSKKNTGHILLQVIQLLENTVNRSAYLALLSENPPALCELLDWFAHSQFISELLLSHPFLLEILLEPPENWCPLTKKELAAQWQRQETHYFSWEEKEERLRQFKLENWIKIARSEKYVKTTALRAGRFLADLAEVIVAAVVAMAYQQLKEKLNLSSVQKGFAILAYGKLGSQELNYNSDLDLVFIYDLPLDESPLVTRLTQKIMHMLTTRLNSGILYPVDTRLRPSGAAGLLVSSLESFSYYQKEEAWLWEHQALSRCRMIVGSKKLQSAFKQLKSYIFTTQRNPLLISEEVLAMRAKIIRHHENVAIKLSKGALVELEFLLQYLVLVNPCAVYATHPINLLRQLVKMSIITTDDARILRKAYKLFHYALHQRLLDDTEVKTLTVQNKVIAIIDRLMKSKE